MGKISIQPKVSLETTDDLSLAYTPGVAAVCQEIAKTPFEVYNLTSKGNMVAIVTDGTAVLGLGDIGPEAAIPVMEGKAAILKKFANVDAFPICLKTKSADEIVNIVEKISPVFGGIILEDISAPRCFEIENRLKARLPIPVMHDDQHGTSVIVLAALENALKIANKKIENVKITIAGSGAAGCAIASLLLKAGAKNIIMCNSKGILHANSYGDDYRPKLIAKLNPENISGSLSTAMKNSDVFIGVSAPNIVTKEMVSSMAEKSIVFAMSNPIPEIMPNLALEAGAFIVGTGRSDLPNQVNNALAYPGIYRGALDCRASQINVEMLLAAAKAIANTIPTSQLTPQKVAPSPFDPLVVKNIAKAVIEAARKTGVANSH